MSFHGHEPVSYLSDFYSEKVGVPRRWFGCYFGSDEAISHSLTTRFSLPAFDGHAVHELAQFGAIIRAAESGPSPKVVWIDLRDAPLEGKLVEEVNGAISGIGYVPVCFFLTRGTQLDAAHTALLESMNATVVDRELISNWPNIWVGEAMEQLGESYERIKGLRPAQSWNEESQKTAVELIEKLLVPFSVARSLARIGGNYSTDSLANRTGLHVVRVFNTGFSGKIRQIRKDLHEKYHRISEEQYRLVPYERNADESADE